MLTALRQRLEKDEAGFTLIELMVVVLIIAILIAIAIPTFLGARQRAQHRSSQSNLRNGLTAEKTAYTDTQVYSTDVAAGGVLFSTEPSLNWVAAGTVPGAGKNDVEVAVGASTQTVCLTGQSADNKFYVIADRATGTTPGTYYNSGTDVNTAALCDAVVTAANTTPTAGGW